MKLLAGPKVFVSAFSASQQNVSVAAHESSEHADESDDSCFDVSDSEDCAILPSAPELVLIPIEKMFLLGSQLPTHFVLAVELPPPKV